MWEKIETLLIIAKKVKSITIISKKTSIKTRKDQRIWKIVIPKDNR